MLSTETPHFLIQDGRVRPRFPRAGISNELADHIAAELVPLEAMDMPTDPIEQLTVQG
jgi:hypothetical protein